jgi:hypothetical protein
MLSLLLGFNALALLLRVAFVFVGRVLGALIGFACTLVVCPVGAVEYQLPELVTLQRFWIDNGVVLVDVVDAPFRTLPTLPLTFL